MKTENEKIVVRKKKYLASGVTFVEILIAVAMFAVAFMPVASIISKTNRQTHEMNYEITAEQIGKCIMDQILRSVPFEKVTKGITFGLGEGNDIKFDITDKTAMHKATFSGNSSGSIIKIEGAEYKWEITVADIDAKNIPLSFWLADDGIPAGSKPWGSDKKSTGSDGLEKAKKFTSDKTKAINYIKGGKSLILKAIKLKISWQNFGETPQFSDPRRKFVLITRKARLEDDISFR